MPEVCVFGVNTYHPFLVNLLFNRCIDFFFE